MRKGQQQQVTQMHAKAGCNACLQPAFCVMNGLYNTEFLGRRGCRITSNQSQFSLILVLNILAWTDGVRHQLRQSHKHMQHTSIFFSQSCIDHHAFRSSQPLFTRIDLRHKNKYTSNETSTLCHTEVRVVNVECYKMLNNYCYKAKQKKKRYVQNYKQCNRTT